jgi:hypothetical protein
MVLTNRHVPLCKGKELLLELHYSQVNMVSTEVHLEFLPGYRVSIIMCRGEGIAPVGRGTFESSQNVQDLLSVIALGDVQFLPNDLKPAIGI